ncbi:MAG TPA: DUF4401 domain-containing protein [Verrucomicrobia bacterium]|nr:DUF4401 domain-containing protein [Verrucomicrobiales bacterium]HIL56202.1 DUF4401 domain-containing protein [Verrucomicrobiota bacterium]
MAENGTGMTAAGLIDSIAEDFSINKDHAREVASERIQKNQMPIYLRTLIGIGSFVSAMFMMGIAFLTFKLDDDAYFPFGIVLAIVAIFLYVKSRRLEQHSPLESFLTLFSFALILAGKIMIVGGGVEWFSSGDEMLTAFVISAIFTCITYPVYTLYMDRLISFTSTLIMGIIWLGNELTSALDWHDKLIGPLFFSIITPLAFVMMIHPRVTRTFRPVSIGLVLVSVGLGCLLTETAPGINQLLGLFNEFEISADELAILMAAPIAMFIVFVYVVAWSAGGWKGMRKRLLIFSIFGALVLCGSMMTCPVLALALIVLGYAQHDRIISVLGSLLLPVSLFSFTRRLDLGLMNTGTLLMLQSVVLLVIFFAFRAWAFTTVKEPLTSTESE